MIVYEIHQPTEQAASSTHCVLGFMEKLVLCIKPAPILFSLLRMGSLDGGKEGNGQKVMIGGPTMHVDPVLHIASQILDTIKSSWDPPKRTTPHPYTADALRKL